MNKPKTLTYLPIPYERKVNYVLDRFQKELFKSKHHKARRQRFLAKKKRKK